MSRVALLPALGLLGASASAQFNLTQIEVDVPLFSQYVWRGLNVVDGPVSQPSLTVSRGAWSVNLWANVELFSASSFGSTEGQLTELDTTIAHTSGLGGSELTLGFVQYTFPHSGGEPATGEAFAILSQPAALSPSVAVFADTIDAGGLYTRVGLSTSVEAMGGEFGLDFGIGYGDPKHNAYYYGSSKGGFSDFGAVLTYSKSVGPNTTMTTYAGYSSLLGSDKVPGNGARENFVVGVGVSQSY